MAEIFTAFGLDLNTPATDETPQRFIRALFDATEGYDGDPKLIKAAYDAAETALAVSQRSEEVARAALATAQQNLADTVIRAPYAGIVTVLALVLAYPVAYWIAFYGGRRKSVFLFLLLLFIRFLPMISVFEMRELVSRQRGHVGAGPSGTAARVDQVEGVTA